MVKGLHKTFWGTLSVKIWLNFYFNTAEMHEMGKVRMYFYEKNEKFKERTFVIGCWYFTEYVLAFTRKDNE